MGFFKKVFKPIGKVTWRSHSFRRVAGVGAAVAGAWLVGPAALGYAKTGLTAAGKFAAGALTSKSAGGAAASLLAARFGGGTPTQGTEYSQPIEIPASDYQGAASFFGGGFGGSGGAIAPPSGTEEFRPPMNPLIKMGLIFGGGLAILFGAVWLTRR